MHNIGSSVFFFTVAAARLDSRARRMAFAGAGHPPGMIVTPGQEPRLLESRSMVLGALPNAVDVEATLDVDLDPGDRIVLYTDGITDVFDSQRRDARSAWRAEICPRSSAAAVQRNEAGYSRSRCRHGAKARLPTMFLSSSSKSSDAAMADLDFSVDIPAAPPTKSSFFSSRSACRFGMAPKWTPNLKCRAAASEFAVQPKVRIAGRLGQPRSCANGSDHGVRVGAPSRMEISRFVRRARVAAMGTCAGSVGNSPEDARFLSNAGNARPIPRSHFHAPRSRSPRPFLARATRAIGNAASLVA